MKTARWFVAQYRWKYYVAASLVSQPWTGLLVFLLAAAFLLQTIAMVWVFGLYFQQVEMQLGADAKQKALLLPLAWSALQTVLFGMFEYKPEVSQFWVIESSPVPRVLRRVERFLSIFSYVLLFGGPLWAAALIHAGHPLGAAVSLMAIAASVAMVIRNSIPAKIVVSAALGGIFGWLGSATLEAVLTPGAFGGMYTGGFDGWRLVLPLVSSLPTLDWMMAFIHLPATAHLTIAVVAVGLAMLMFNPSGAKLRSPALLVSRMSKLPSARLAYTLLYLTENLPTNLMAVAALLAYVYSTRFFDVPQLPIVVVGYLAALFLVQPPQSPLVFGGEQHSVGAVVRVNTALELRAQAQLIRAWIELGAFATVIVVTPFASWSERAMIGSIFLLFWIGAPWLARLGVRWVWPLLIAIGSALLWTF